MTNSASISFESMQIFDRWGNMVHESRGDLEWDGRVKRELLSDAVYVYIIRYRDGNEERYVSGMVTLIR